MGVGKWCKQRGKRVCVPGAWFLFGNVPGIAFNDSNSQRIFISGALWTPVRHKRKAISFHKHAWAIISDGGLDVIISSAEGLARVWGHSINAKPWRIDSSFSRRSRQANSCLHFASFCCHRVYTNPSPPLLGSMLGKMFGYAWIYVDTWLVCWWTSSPPSLLGRLITDNVLNPCLTDLINCFFYNSTIF